MYNGYYNFYPGASGFGTNFMGNMGGYGATYGNVARGAGLFAGIRNSVGRVNWGNLLTNTQKTINVVNQAIPVINQVRPIINNAKTMFKIAGALNSDKTTTNDYKSNNNMNQSSSNNTDNSPQFFA